MSIDECYKNKILSFIKAFLPNANIYLFGSRARGTHHETSDIDIAIDDKKIIDNNIIIQLKNGIDTLNIPYTVDVVDINNVSEILKKQIERDKVLWK